MSDQPEVVETEDRDVYMSICFHKIPLSVAECLKSTIEHEVPAGTSYAVYFDNAIVVDHI